MQKVHISNRAIGDGEPVFVIVEIGSNYNQNFKTAVQMIDLAKDAGADAVKFQIFNEKRLYPPDAGRVGYLKKQETINELVKKAEVPDNMHQMLQEYCLSRDIIYLCTPTDEDVADYLEGLDVPAYKIASYAITHLPLLRHVARKGKPVILSTGASHLHEIAEAVKVILDEGNSQIILLQCVAKYPAEPAHTNLLVMDMLRSAFGVPVGMSDHSIDPFQIPYAAVARGASVIEKHLTMNRNQEGPDHAFAIEPDELFAMIKGIHAVQASIGSAEKTVEPWEEELRRFTYRSIFASKDIHKDELLIRDNIDCLRPGKKTPGIPVKYLDIVIQTRVNKGIASGTAIQWTDLIRKII